MIDAIASSFVESLHRRSIYQDALFLSTAEEKCGQGEIGDSIDVVDFSGVREEMIAALKQMSAELADGALLTVDARRTRLRVLLLRRA